MDPLCQAAGAPGETRDSSLRQGLEVHAPGGISRQIAEHGPQGVATIQLVVAVGQDGQRRRAANPPAEIFEQIERRCVGPMHVLEHEHGRLLATLQLVQESAEDREPVGGGSHQLQQRALYLKRDVVQRTQRLRREQRVAAAKQRARLGALRREEILDQAGLADPGLAVHERDTTLAGSCLTQRFGESPQCGVALQQLHRFEVAFGGCH